MTVVGEAEDGRDAFEKARTLRPDLIVMDVNMPGADGVDGVRAIRAAGIETRIVMLTISEDDDDLFESIKAGANGYLLKNVRPEQLFDDLRGVMRGEAPIAPAIAGKLLAALRHGGVPFGRRAGGPGGGGGGPGGGAGSAGGGAGGAGGGGGAGPGGHGGSGGSGGSGEGQLTRREQEILELVADGLSNKEIAARLVITEGTVKNHVHNALEKLHLTNRVQAAAYAVRQGYVTHDPDG